MVKTYSIHHSMERLDGGIGPKTRRNINNAAGAQYSILQSEERVIIKREDDGIMF